MWMILENFTVNTRYLTYLKRSLAYLSVGLILLLQSCSATQRQPLRPVSVPQVITKTQYVGITCNIPSRVPQLKMLPVKVKVLDNEGKMYVALDAKNYKNLSLNLSQLVAYLDKNSFWITFITKCISDNEKNVVNLNQNY